MCHYKRERKKKKKKKISKKNKQTKKQKKKQKKEIALNHSLDIDFKGFMRIYKKYTVEP